MQLPKIEMTPRAGFSNLLLMVDSNKKTDTKGMPIKYPEFAERVQAAMIDSGMSVTEIKEKLKITYEMARRYTLGQAMPRQAKMEALARVLNVKPEALQFGTVELADPKKPRNDIEQLVIWPFSVSKKRFDKLPREEKERIDGLLEHTISAWENKANTKSRRA